jgi:hypothetical protein
MLEDGRHSTSIVSASDTSAFGFLDPQAVIHGVHLIPVFAYGQTRELLPASSLGCVLSEDNKDWQQIYVSM